MITHTISKIDGGFRLDFGPYSIGDFRTRMVCESIMERVYRTIQRLPAFSAVELAVLCGFYPSQAISEKDKYRALANVWGITKTTEFYHSKYYLPLWFEDVDLMPLFVQGVSSISY